MPIWVHLVCNATKHAPKNATTHATRRRMRHGDACDATTHAPKAHNSVKFCSTKSSDVNPQDDAAHL